MLPENSVGAGIVKEPEFGWLASRTKRSQQLQMNQEHRFFVALQ
ncbi:MULTISPECIES: hypothetical protein [unclassified Nostoc]|nr:MULTISPECIES: hypothetical protein [unclassified Nostoc]MDZ8223283.1 hypothetical protein [Nostoc sp. ChiVER01]